jgi:hypothetical protein
MKRRLFALLAAPALAVGFAFASLGTDQAQAYDPFPSVHQLCAFIGSKMAEAEYYGTGRVMTTGTTRPKGLAVSLTQMCPTSSSRR